MVGMAVEQRQIRRDTAANWASVNPTPASGELCYETDTGVLKIGDGTTPYVTLDVALAGQYEAFLPAPSGGDDTATIQASLDANIRTVLGEGMWRADGLVIPAGHTLSGRGGSAMAYDNSAITSIRANDGATSAWVVEFSNTPVTGAANSAGSVLERLAIHGNSLCKGVWVRGLRQRVTDVAIHMTSEEGLIVDSGASLIEYVIVTDTFNAGTPVAPTGSAVLNGADHVFRACEFSGLPPGFGGDYFGGNWAGVHINCSNSAFESVIGEFADVGIRLTNLALFNKFTNCRADKNWGHGFGLFNGGYHTFSSCGAHDNSKKTANTYDQWHVESSVHNTFASCHTFASEAVNARFGFWDNTTAGAFENKYAAITAPNGWATAATGGGATFEMAASAVSVADSGGYFDGSHVEAALQEVGLDLSTTFETGLEPDPLNLADRMLSAEVAITNLADRVASVEQAGPVGSQTIDAVAGANTINLNNGTNIHVASTAGAWTANFTNVPSDGVVVNLSIDVTGNDHEVTIPDVQWYGTAPITADWDADETNVIRLTKLPNVDEWVAEWVLNIATPAVVTPVSAEVVSWSKNTTWGTTISVPYPAGIVAGNTLVLVVGWGDRTIATPPAGWTDLASWNSGASSFSNISAWYKVATGSESGSADIVLSGNQDNVAYMVQVSGAVDVTTAVVESGPDAFLDVPSATATDSGLVLSFATSKDVTAPYTTFGAPGFGTLIDQSNAQFNQQTGAFAAESVGAGATGTKRWTWSNGGAIKAFNVILSDSVPSTEPPVEPPPEPPISDSFPSPTLMAYDMFGEPYRSDGRTKDGVVIGAPPWGKHELVPLRLNPSFDFYEGSRFGQNPSWEGRFYSPWGQIFLGEGNTARNVRLQVRDSHTLYLDSGNVWRNFRGDVSNWQMQGAYLDTYFFGVGLSSSVRDESANGGGWSVSLAPLVDTPAAASWHWWLNGYYPRSAIPAGCRGMFQAQQVRLISEGDNPDADNCRFIASWSADAYADERDGTPPITPYVQPRMKRVRGDWVWLTSHAFTAWWSTGFGPANILANPPTSWP